MMLAVLKKSISLLLIATSLFSKQYCYFIPPDNWEMEKLPKDAPVDVGFLGKMDHISRPSLYLATEDVEISLKEYLKSVRNIYKKSSNFTFKDIGSISTKAGKAHLAEIESITKVGTIKMLQLILIQNKKAYVLTGGNLKENFLNTHKAFLKTFRSFTLTDNPITLIQDHIEQQKLTDALKKETSSKKFKNLLDKNKDPFLKKIIMKFFHDKNKT